MDARAVLMPVEKGSPCPFSRSPHESPPRCFCVQAASRALQPLVSFSSYPSTTPPSFVRPARNMAASCPYSWALHAFILHSLAVVRCTYSVQCKHLTEYGASCSIYLRCIRHLYEVIS